MREQLAAALRPLIDRCHTGHCWVKGKNGPRQIDEPFDALKLSEHLTGGKAYGLCPIAPGSSTTRVACLDFDSHKGETGWADMRAIVDRVMLALELDGYQPIAFRSSGGKGVHVFVLWDTPQDAYSVRELMRTALATCDLVPGAGGVSKGQVEVFPKQDYVPADGFGSMFILPFTGKSELLV